MARVFGISEYDDCKTDRCPSRKFDDAVQIQTEEDEVPSRCGVKVRTRPLGRGDENDARNQTVNGTGCRRPPSEEKRVQTPVSSGRRERPD